MRIRSGDVVRIRQVRPDDAPALAHAYANLGEQSRYRRFFTAMPELPDQTLKAAVEVDHDNHEALVATPLLSAEILGECRFVRRTGLIPRTRGSRWSTHGKDAGWAPHCWRA